MSEELQYEDAELNGAAITFEQGLETSSGAVNVSEARENVRSFIATLFVGGYLAIVVFLIILNTFYKLGSESVKDFLLAVGSPLGFVIGFYFKGMTEDSGADINSRQ